MKMYATTYLLGLTLLLGEIHSFFQHPIKYEQKDGAEITYEKIHGQWQIADKQNWVINGYEPMTLAWNLKFLFEGINVIIYFGAALFLAKYPNRLNKTSMLVFFQAAIIDLGLQFWDFKRNDYHLIYFCIAGTFLVVFWKELKQRLIG